MIQKGSYLNVADNSGAKIAYCIQNISKPSSRYAFLGDILLVSIKQLRTRRRFASKIKKGVLAYALIVRSNIFYKFLYGDRMKFNFTSVILFFRKTYKLIGTRIFGFLSLSFRYSQFLRILAICTGAAY